MLQFQNYFSPTLDLIVWVMQYHMRSMPFSFWMYVDHVFQLESLVYDIIRLCAHDCPFFYFFWIFEAHFKCRLNCSRPISSRRNTQPFDLENLQAICEKLILCRTRVVHPLTSGPRRTQRGFWLAHPHLPQWHKMGILAHQMRILAITPHRNLNGDFGKPNGDSHELAQI